MRAITNFETKPAIIVPALKRLLIDVDATLPLCPQ